MTTARTTQKRSSCSHAAAHQGCPPRRFARAPAADPGQPGDVAVPARQDPHDGGQGQAAAAVRRAPDHQGQAGRPAQPPRDPEADPGPRDRAPPDARDRPVLRRPQRRLHAHHQDAAAPGRQRPHGRDRAGVAEDGHGRGGPRPARGRVAAPAGRPPLPAAAAAEETGPTAGGERRRRGRGRYGDRGRDERVEHRGCGGPAAEAAGRGEHRRPRTRRTARAATPRWPTRPRPRRASRSRATRTRRSTTSPSRRTTGGPWPRSGSRRRTAAEAAGFEPPARCRARSPDAASTPSGPVGGVTDGGLVAVPALYPGARRRRSRPDRPVPARHRLRRHRLLRLGGPARPAHGRGCPDRCADRRAAGPGHAHGGRPHRRRGARHRAGRVGGPARRPRPGVAGAPARPDAARRRPGHRGHRRAAGVRRPVRGPAPPLPLPDRHGGLGRRPAARPRHAGLAAPAGPRRRVGRVRRAARRARLRRVLQAPGGRDDGAGAAAPRLGPRLRRGRRGGGVGRRLLPLDGAQPGRGAARRRPRAPRRRVARGAAANGGSGCRTSPWRPRTG